MSRTERGDPLDKECIALHRYLAGRAPDAYVIEKYRAAHASIPVLAAPADWFNAFLLRGACLHGITMHLVQSYVRWFAQKSLIRKKAILLLAIVECIPQTLDVVQRTAVQSRARLLAASFSAMAGFAAWLLTATVLIAPVHLAAAVHSRFGARAQALEPVPGRGT